MGSFVVLLFSIDRYLGDLLDFLVVDIPQLTITMHWNHSLSKLSSQLTAKLRQSTLMPTKGGFRPENLPSPIK